MHRRSNAPVYADILHPDHPTPGHQHRSDLSYPALCNPAKPAHRPAQKNRPRGTPLPPVPLLPLPPPSPPTQPHLTKVYLRRRRHEYCLRLCPPLRRPERRLQIKYRSLGRGRSLHGHVRRLGPGLTSSHFPKLVLLTRKFAFPESS